MKHTYPYPVTGLILAFTALFFSCERDLNELDPATYPTTAEVFIDAFSGDMGYAAFGGSDVRAFDVDTDVKYKGTSSMRIAVPDYDDPAGAYAGGVYFSNTGRDLSGYNVLTFWAKASRPASIDLIGFGNDLGENKYQAAIAGVEVNTNWKKYYIPIPDPSKLKAERGLLFFSEGPENGTGYTFWIDEARFEKLGTIAHARSGILDGADVTQNAETGNTFTIQGYAVANLPNGVDQRVETAPSYFDFASSDTGVAGVGASGVVNILDAGTAVITATLAGVESEGSLTIVSSGAPVLPQVAAPPPTVPADKVISVFSNVYDNVPVDFFNGYWQFSTAQVFDVQINGDDVKRYTQLNFVGIQFTAPTIDASTMTHFHIDIWTPDPVGPSTVFKVLLVDIGADGAFGGGDDSSHEITINSSMLATGSWISLDLPLASFTGLSSRTRLAQIVLSGGLPNLFVDNIFFYREESATEPAVAAPAPTLPQANVISLFSEVYNNVPVDTWRTPWSSAAFEDVFIAGNAAKKYSALDFVGIETIVSQIDATNMTHFHIDAWSADFNFFGVKLVDFGADGAFGGGDDVEHQVNFEMPAQGQWISYDIPLSEFTGLTTRKHISQFILVGKPTGANTVYVDNLYFHN
ncbi:MAG: carbohydrate-binding protein [Haliscomenobacteraceae bacterium CHB4]|nr:carbohydrate-binding protein [Haliscomenobacteraceae bacterium CHB4]